jgi:ABC-2 type transport system permease protein
MTAPEPALRPTDGSRPAPQAVPRTPGAFAALYRLMLTTQVTRARVLSLSALGLISVLVGLAIGRGDVIDPMREGARFVNGFGLTVLVPVATLVFASAALGDTNEDGTLVYLWLRPVRRSKIVGAAALASLTVAWPMVTIPLVLAAALTGAGSALVVGTVAAATVSTLAYVGLFVALGLRVKRALVWGLLYIFIWEGFVATGNDKASKLAIRSYGRSVLSSITDVPFRLVEIDAPWRWAVPLAVLVGGLAYATRRLSRQDVT